MRVLFFRYKHLFFILLVCLFMLALVLNPSVYMQSCLNGLNIWGMSVLPALFPFFFFSGILTRLHALDLIGAKLSRFMQKIFHTPGSSGVIYLLSIVSGYPVGAKVTSDLYSAGKLTTDEVVRINSFASTSGPLFIIGAVGVGMFSSHTLGVILLISHLLGALANGLLYRNYHYAPTRPVRTQSTSTVNDTISATMYDSIISILIVGGYIVIANIIIDMLFNVGILDFLSLVLGKIAEFFGAPGSIGTGISSGIVEITRGCKELSSIPLDPRIVAPLACAIISWGGLSIHFQALTFLSKCHISASFYMLQKFTQSLLSAGICALLCLIFM